MMRDRSLDEFASIFERASIPVLDIPGITLARVSAVLKGDPLDRSALDLAGYLKRRFGTDIVVHWSGSANESQVRREAGARQFRPATAAFTSTAQLVAQVLEADVQMVLLPEPPDEAGRVVDLDVMVEAVTPPVLLVRVPIVEPSAVFRRLLHSLTGNFRQTQNFAYSFTLVEAQGSLLLLHTIDDADLDAVRDTLRVSPDIATADRSELLQALTRQGERYLKAVVTAGRDQPYDVGYRLAIGAVMQMVEGELARGDYGLLVVGCHREGRSHVGADEYRLMHQVRNIPVLAL